MDGEEYHANSSTLASLISQGSPDVYILPLTEVSLPVAKQPARSGEGPQVAFSNSLHPAAAAVSSCQVSNAMSFADILMCPTVTQHIGFERHRSFFYLLKFVVAELWRKEKEVPINSENICCSCYKLAANSPFSTFEVL